ncbi:hypothetical protein RI367_007507 [Sorochytrium milnesiophthora]
MTTETVYLGVDIALSIVVISLQLVNVRSARRFLRKKSLSRWLLNAYTASFLFGAVGGALSLIESTLQLAGSPSTWTENPLSSYMSLSLIFQTYFQGIVILQRVHIVNAYIVDADAITVQELFRKRWPEATLTLAGVGVAAVQFIGISRAVNHLLSLAWIAGIIALDVTLSITTFNKVHRMLNTSQTAVSWAWNALRSRPSLAASSMPSVDSAPSSQSAKNLRDGRVSQRIVSAWTLLTLSIFCAALLYLVSWLVFANNEYMNVIMYQLAWIFGSIWQRGGLFYIEAVKIVAMQNRASKQYIGTLTRTGIRIDIVLSVVIIVLQLVNVHSARQFLRQKTLSSWLINAYTASFLFGAVGGALSLIQTGLRLVGLLGMTQEDTLSLLVSLAILVQTYFQGVVILQRPHIVNAYRVDSDAITLLELLRKRWPEVVLSVAGVCIIAVQFIPAISFELNSELSMAWLAGIIALDVVLSITTFNKVHRMLNTHQTALSWAWHALRSRRSTVAGSLARQSTSKLNDGQASWRVVSAWVLLTLSIVCAALIYLASWLAFPDDPYLSYTAYQLAWIFGSVWQRGGLFYLEAVRIVAMQNRASKQYLGTLTRTGIRPAASVATREVEVSKEPGL